MIQPPQVRATVLSTVGQADAVGEALGGPTIGLVAALTSPGLAIVAAGTALAPVVVVLGRLSTRTSQLQVGEPRRREVPGGRCARHLAAQRQGRGSSRSSE